VFAGQRSAEDLAAHYASADLLLFPSLTETFGNVTTEAMASGLPVVAFNSAAAGQLIASGRDGFLATGDDELAFVSAALQAANIDRRRACGAAARLRVAGLGWSDVVARFEAVLDSAIDLARPAGIEPATLGFGGQYSIH
jgi:glycosyltransferase involved in cell wall biosynthesis